MHTLDDGSVLGAPRARQLRDRASEFRTNLGARQQADAILAAAAEVRRDAGIQAEVLVAEAEALSADLTSQARSIMEQARERAEGILAIARATADDIRQQAHAQAATDREEFQAELETARQEQASAGGQPIGDALADIEKAIRGLGAALSRATGSAAEAGRAIGHLRTEIIGTLPNPSEGVPEHDLARAADRAPSTLTTQAEVGTAGASKQLGEPHPVPAPETTTVLASAQRPTEPPEERTELRPLGWLFRSDRP